MEQVTFNSAFFITIFNFLIFAGLLYFLLNKKIRNFFVERSNQIHKDIGSAKKVYEEAFLQLKKIENKLNTIDTDTKSMVDSVKEQAKLEKYRLVSQAHEMARKIESDAQNMSQHIIQKAKRELQQEAFLLATDLAKKQIQKQITGDDHIRLAQNSLEQVKEVKTT